jgi:ADP-heptose:LPS heptosyltransferase
MTDSPLRKKKIAVVQLSRLGDILMTLPLIDGLCEEYPGADIHLFVNGLFENLLPASHAFKLVPLPFNRMFEKLRKIENDDQRRYKLDEYLGQYFGIAYDLVINCSGLDVSAVFASLLLGKERRGLMYSRDESFIHASPELSLFTKNKTGRRMNWNHQVEIFLSNVQGVVPEPLYRCSERLFRDTMEGFVGSKPIPERYIVVFPGASIPEKEIGRDLLSALVMTLLAHTDYHVVFAGQKQDGIDMGLRALDRDRVIDLSGKTSYSELFGLVYHCECVISNDSGPMHVAALLNKKNMVISTGSAFFPETTGYNDNILVFVPEDPCYPCPWIGTACSKRWRCKTSLNTNWIAQCLLQYLGQTTQPIDVKQGMGYRTCMDAEGLSFTPFGNNVLDARDWYGLLYQSFWKSRMFGWDAAKILARVIRPYRMDPDILETHRFTFRSDLKALEKWAVTLIEDFERFFKTGAASYLNRINRGIDTLFRWSTHETTVAPLLHYYSTRYHSVTSGDFLIAAKIYHENTLALKDDIDCLQGLLSFFDTQLTARVEQKNRRYRSRSEPSFFLSQRTD